jgi:hypothetical protein
VKVVAPLPQGRTAAAQCDLFKKKPVPVIFEPPSSCDVLWYGFGCDLNPHSEYAF